MLLATLSSKKKKTHFKVSLCSVVALGLAKEVEMKHSFSMEISLTRLPSPTPLIQHSQSEV